MYQIKTTKYFDKRFSKLTSKDKKLKQLTVDKIIQLSEDPFWASLKSHKVGEFWSSWVNGEIRIIWTIDKNEIKVLELLDIGTHKQVY